MLKDLESFISVANKIPRKRFPALPQLSVGDNKIDDFALQLANIIVKIFKKIDPTILMTRTLLYQR